VKAEFCWNHICESKAALLWMWWWHGEKGQRLR